MNDIQVNLQHVIEHLLPEAILVGMEDALQLLENETVERCPVDDGILRGSITHEKEFDGNFVVGVVKTDVDYAPYVHEGTGIYAENSRAENIPWVYCDAAGRFHTTKGQKPNPFLQEAGDSCMADIPRCFEGRL